MNNILFLYLATILSGFALLQLTLTGSLAALQPILAIVGALAVIVFSGVIIFKGIMALFKR